MEKRFRVIFREDVPARVGIVPGGPWGFLRATGVAVSVRLGRKMVGREELRWGLDADAGVWDGATWYIYP